MWERGRLPGRVGLVMLGVALLVASASAEPAARGVLEEQPIRTTTTSSPLPDGSAGAPSGGMNYLRVLGALGVVIGLILILRWCGRFVFPAGAGGGSGRGVEVLSRTALSPKQQIMMLRVGRRIVVVGDSGSQMNPLCEITDPDEVALLVGQMREQAASAPSRAFGSMFGKFRRTFEADGESPATPADPGDEQRASADTNQEELSGLRERVRLLAEQFKA